MKFYDIALFLFIFQIVSAYILSISPDMGFTEAISFHEPTETELAEAQTKFEQATMTSESIASEDMITKMISWVSEAIKTAAAKVFEPFKRYVLSLPFMLMMLGVSPAFAWLISTPLYVIQIVGIVQFITGRSFKEIE